MKLVLDCNIYDLLGEDEDCLSNLTNLIQNKGWKVLVPATLLHELLDSPFKGVPNWINVEEDLDSVFILGHTQLGTGRLGDGDIYYSHKGNSTKIKDSVIVDYAVKNADIFVSEDKRALKSLLKMKVNREVYNYNDFKNLISQKS